MNGNKHLPQVSSPSQLSLSVWCTDKCQLDFIAALYPQHRGETLCGFNKKRLSGKAIATSISLIGTKLLKGRQFFAVGHYKGRLHGLGSRNFYDWFPTHKGSYSYKEA